LVLWFSICWSGVELRVMCPVCRMLQHPANRTHLHSTTRVTTYTCYMYCCHNTGIELQDFKSSVLNNSVTLTRYRHTP